MPAAVEDETTTKWTQRQQSQKHDFFPVVKLPLVVILPVLEKSTLLHQSKWAWVFGSIHEAHIGVKRWGFLSEMKQFHFVGFFWSLIKLNRFYIMVRAHSATFAGCETFKMMWVTGVILPSYMALRNLFVLTDRWMVFVLIFLCYCRCQWGWGCQYVPTCLKCSITTAGLP